MTYVLRGIAIVSGSLGLFWTVGLLADICLGYDPSPIVLLACAMATTFVAAALAFLRSPLALAVPRSTPTSQFFWTLVLSVVHSYLAMVPILGVIAYISVLLVGNPRANDAGIFVILAAIWFPLWLAPGVGALWTCRRVRAGWTP